MTDHSESDEVRGQISLAGTSWALSISWSSVERNGIVDIGGVALDLDSQELASFLQHVVNSMPEREGIEPEGEPVGPIVWQSEIRSALGKFSVRMAGADVSLCVMKTGNECSRAVDLRRFRIFAYSAIASLESMPDEDDCRSRRRRRRN